MAVRTDAASVKIIIETELSDPVVDAFITTANLIVTDVLGSDTTLSTAQLTEIEKWLTAHLLASTREKQEQKEKVGDADVTYQGKTGMGLDATMYGQQVKILDTTGKMAQKLGKKSATMTAVENFD